MHRTAANELLLLVVVNTLLLLLFAFSFAKIRGGDWRSLGVLPAFLVALFVEMYGFPLTVYLLSAWLTNRYPQIDPFSYSAGRFWQTLLGLDDTSVAYSVYLVSYVLIGAGFVLIAYAWRKLYEAQRANKLARTGPYSYVRHPQYLGFMLVMLGLLLAWPSLSTAIMFPILTLMYVRLARVEERSAVEQTRQHACTYRCIFLRPSSSIRRVHTRHDWTAACLPALSTVTVDVRPPRSGRRAKRCRAIRRRVPSL